VTDGAPTGSDRGRCRSIHARTLHPHPATGSGSSELGQAGVGRVIRIRAAVRIIPYGGI